MYVIIQRKIPTKLEDSGSFTIPCTIGEVKISYMHCDFGVNINLMSLALVNTLNLGDPNQ